MGDFIGTIANLGSIATGVVAVWAWVSFKCQARGRRARLEDYLKQVMDEAQRDPRQSGEGMRSLFHLMAHLYMTESQVYEAAFASNKVKSWPRTGEDGVAERVMFQYNPSRRSVFAA
ncbi:hypothetical protein [Sinorhizobium sp. BJ1]|uniref:hypothetical protein n=1 Tax=Sinorhizobium sp. BJ1 TaxID=2035455 RepID=UPI001184EB85|nr:hypothetical protein [Sinorhizobium sp. BJ1]